MKIEQALHMVGGAGETSYASNSRLQEKAILVVKSTLQETVANVYDELYPVSLVVADLGCSSGPNAFLVMSHIIDAVAGACRAPGRRRRTKEIWFMLNDLPSNDFNAIFRSLPEQEKKVGDELMPYHVAGVPGSFYGRLFPCNSLHVVHSSYSLMWLSKVPVGLESEMGDDALNKGNIYISKTSPPIVSRLYYEQFKRDFSSFLRRRSEELVFGGQMILSFLGRRCLDPSSSSAESFPLWDLLAEALNTMTMEGFFEEEMVDSFNLPWYAASLPEVKAVIHSEGSFDLHRVQIFDFDWDPFDDSNEDSALDNFTSGMNVAKCIRAVMEPLLMSHFGVGGEIIDEVFARYAKNVADHLAKDKTKHVVLVITLKKSY